MSGTMSSCWQEVMKSTDNRVQSTDVVLLLFAFLVILIIVFSFQFLPFSFQFPKGFPKFRDVQERHRTRYRRYPVHYL